MQESVKDETTPETLQERFRKELFAGLVGIELPEAGDGRDPAGGALLRDGFFSP